MKSKPLPLSPLLAAAALALQACAAPALFERYDWPIREPAEEPGRDWSYGQAPPQEGSAAAAAGGAAEAAPAPLLGWEAGVVDSSQPGVVVEGSAPPRSIGPAQEGRMHIIELYSQVLDERDALADEVGRLEAALMKTRQLLDQGDGELAEAHGRSLRLEEELERLREENRDLAARLTTAQIRRLEAEKLLLEAKIQMHRTRPSGAAPTEEPGP